MNPHLNVPVDAGSSSPRRFRLRIRTLLLLIACMAAAIGVLDAFLLAPYRREHNAAATLASRGGQIVFVDETPSILRETPFERLFDLRTVAFVDLDHSGVTDADLALLPKFPHCATVVMSDTAITDAGLVHLRKKKQGLIDLSRTGVSDVELGVNDTLTVLSLSGNRLKRLGIEGCWNLLELDLSRSDITDATLHRLTGLRSLAWLNLGCTRVTPGAVARLQKALPGLTILQTPGQKTPLMAIHRPTGPSDPTVNVPRVSLISGKSTPVPGRPPSSARSGSRP